MHGNIAANEMTQQSDLILAVGMRFSDRVTGDVKNYAPHAKIIHIDIDSAELGKNLPVELPIHADAGEALEAMKSGIRHKDARRGSTWPKAATGANTRKSSARAATRKGGLSRCTTRSARWPRSRRATR